MSPKVKDVLQHHHSAPLQVSVSSKWVRACMEGSFNSAEMEIALDQETELSHLAPHIVLRRTGARHNRHSTTFTRGAGRTRTVRGARAPYSNSTYLSFDQATGVTCVRGVLCSMHTPTSAEH